MPLYFDESEEADRRVLSSTQRAPGEPTTPWKGLPTPRCYTHSPREEDVAREATEACPAAVPSVGLEQNHDTMDSSPWGSPDSVYDPIYPQKPVPSAPVLTPGNPLHLRDDLQYLEGSNTYIRTPYAVD